jgi:hypothetical protein
VPYKVERPVTHNLISDVSTVRGLCEVGFKSHGQQSEPGPFSGTCGYSLSSPPHIIWRRIGGHAIFSDR